MLKLKRILIGFFILVIAYSYSLYFILQAGLGLPSEGIFFHLYSGVLSVFSFMLYLFTFNKSPVHSTISAFLICITVLLLYSLTSIIYGYYNSYYISYLLSTGVRFVPAIFVGCVMLKIPDLLQKVEKALLPFIVLYTIILANIVFNAELGGNVGQTFNIEGGMTYQSISYYSIFAFGLTMYLIVFSKKSKYLRFLLIGLAILQFLMCIMAGGRGAFVLGVVFYFYFILKTISLKNAFLYIVLLGVIFLFLQLLGENNEVFSLGFNRIFNFFGDSDAVDNDGRWIRWNIAFDSFLASPIFGHGLGSIFYEVGFYSHNIITDLLCEGGILLVSIFGVTLYAFYHRVKKLILLDYRYEIFVIIFLSSFMLTSFSGYYLAETGIWLSVFFILNKKVKCDD